MAEQKTNQINEKYAAQLSELKCRNRRRYAFYAVSAMQIASFCLLYYLGRSSRK
ncbi:MAG: hypothetical protein ACK5MK_09875 [Dysgonomonas sp.]